MSQRSLRSVLTKPRSGRYERSGPAERHTAANAERYKNDAAPGASPSGACGSLRPRYEDPWVEVLRGAIEADLSSREEIDGERQQARAVRGALKFVTYLASARDARRSRRSRDSGGSRVVRRRCPRLSAPAFGSRERLHRWWPRCLERTCRRRAASCRSLRFGFDAPFMRVAPGGRIRRWTRRRRRAHGHSTTPVLPSGRSCCSAPCRRKPT